MKEATPCNEMKRACFLPAILVFFFFSCTISYGVAQHQPSFADSLFRAKKSIHAIRVSTPPKIDAIMDESFWKDCPVAENFVEYGPRNGTVPPVSTEVRFAYDDEALYVFAIMYDPHPDSICKEMGRRDEVESLTTDYISFDILPYNDGLNMFEFKVTPAGLQNDCKYSAVGVDITWDAVWENACKITDKGWVAEVKFPYSALRFPKVENQVWGFNMWRNFHRKNEWSTWSWVDNKDNNIFGYYGRLEGMHNVRPPVRLSFSPYISGYVEKTPESKNWSYILRGGLDLRYGINESYTLDMMLIPDFGQVQSDDQILNLTPFEVHYDERRQFFTEATELFNKCGIFYTRRVGSMPRNYLAPYDSLKANERISDNPDETRIINATKISGRNSKGLGIGFFNAMTTNTWARLEDTITGATRKVSTQPFTNYNVLVIDQNLKHNSYITLINTNYWTPDDQYSANVTGVETQIYNKKAVYAIFGRLNISQKYQNTAEPDFGHDITLALLKTGGKFQFQFVREEIDNHYDPNDMGFLTNNNEAVNQAKLYWNVLDPVGKILTNRSEFILTYLTLYKPYAFEGFQIMADNTTSYKNFWTTYIEASLFPWGFHDYYEPRTWGWVYKRPLYYSFTYGMGTNNRKPFRIGVNLYAMNSPSDHNFHYTVTLTPRIRFSDRFMISLTTGYDKNLNNYGWVNTVIDSLNNLTTYFGRRDVSTINNILTVKYIFNTKASLSLRARHYWSTAKYLDYYTLNFNGKLDNSNYSQNHDINFNAFTADLQFVWYFAPGSELSFVWKNIINTLDQAVSCDYWNNLGTTLRSPQTNSFSVRVIYYLDYLSIKKALGKKH
ncbi:MAG: DUF5916 domain-containing protein [Bacteroidetes bacterium]|nr:DUF5916 domain-containing protein [Bacteroidota bacterium]